MFLFLVAWGENGWNSLEKVRFKEKKSLNKTLAVKKTITEEKMSCMENIINVELL